MTTSWLKTWTLRRLSGFAMLVSALSLWAAAHAVPAQAQGLAATGAWSSGITDGKEGTWELRASKSENGFTGTLSTTGPGDFADGTVFGSMTPTGDVHFGILYNDVEEATFAGTVSGGALSGTYTTKDGDSGTWSGKLAKPE